VPSRRPLCTITGQPFGDLLMTRPSVNKSDSLPADQAPVIATGVTIRVRYVECDALGVAHHSAYPIWFEIARTELLREQGMAYRDLEAAGTCFLVTEMHLHYRRPARYDDLIRIHVRQCRLSGARIVHDYQVYRDGRLLVEGQTTLACVDRDGKPQRLPDSIRRFEVP